MSTRNELEAVLEKAEAELAREAAKAAAAAGDRDLATARLDKARAYCRRVRTALYELGHSEELAFPCHGLQSEPPISPQATGAPAPASAATCANRPVAKAAGEDTPRPRYATAIPPAAPAPSPALHWLLRQTVGLTALVLAYLVYFHLDVRLQIMRLPVLILELLLK